MDNIKVYEDKITELRNRIEFLEEYYDKVKEKRADILDALDVLYEDCVINCMKCDPWDDYRCYPADPRVEFYKFKNGVADILEEQRGVIYKREGEDYE